MDKLLDWIVTTYWGGIICLVLSVTSFILVKKIPEKPENSWFAGDMKGIAGGVFLLIAGLCIIIGKLIGKL